MTKHPNGPPRISEFPIVGGGVSGMVMGHVGERRGVRSRHFRGVVAENVKGEIEGIVIIGFDSNFFFFEDINTFFVGEKEDA